MYVEVSPFTIGQGVLQGYIYVVIFVILLAVIFGLLMFANPSFRELIGV